MFRRFHFTSRLQRNPSLILLLVLVFFGLILVSSTTTSSWSLKNYYTKFQRPYGKYDATSSEYDLVIVADKDKRSKVSDNEWESLLLRAKLRRNENNKYSIEWLEDKKKKLSMKIGEAGRGMELSELVNFGDDLLTCDDRTGIVSFIEDGDIIPFHILMDGNGHVKKGFKCEWATVKDGILYVGSTGKEWTTPDGKLLNNNPLWIKTIDKEGKVEHIDWSANYQKMRKATGAENPGYLIHEAGGWNPVLRRWFFFPRKYSVLPYDDKEDETRGSNIVISADENFKDVRHFRLGPHHPEHGFSSLKFIPGREHEVIALQSEEHEDRTASYITVFDLNTRQILMEEVEIGLEKYEGVEIIQNNSKKMQQPFAHHQLLNFTK